MRRDASLVVLQMASLLETVTADMQATRRTLRERADPPPSSGSSGGGSPAALENSVQELDRKLGQLVVNTEMLKGGQRRLGANVRVIENRTRYRREYRVSPPSTAH